MMRNYIRNIILSVVAIVFSAAHAGSFEDFFIAIRNDNATVINELLDRGFDPNTRDEKGQPGLVIAMRERSLKAGAALLARPATDVNALNQAGESPLMMSALKGDLAGMELLIARGAKIAQPGWSPLLYAATGPEPKAVQLLLDRGAAVDASSPNDTTPLMMAAQYGSEDSVKLLIARGADLKRRNQQGLSAVDFARKAGRDSLAKRLEEAQR